LEVKKPKILVAEDDADDQLLLQSAFTENGGNQKLQFVNDGVDLMVHLKAISDSEREGQYPDFIMLDLNMPRKNGKEALQEIKQHPVFKTIPVIIYTTTRDEREVKKCYELGANNYIVKPSDFQSMIRMVDTVLRYWLSTACVPPLSQP
jgi:CheY-like chemotaxis protein